MLRRALLLALTLLLALPAFADWRDDHGQPDWARRGFCQWGHGANVKGRIKWAGNGFGVDVPNAHLLLDCGRNLMQTISYLDKEARRIGETEGQIKRQPYICSKTIWWRSEFPKAPQLERCTIVKPDGSRVLLYNNPERYGGCYSSPIWLEYMKTRVDSLMADKAYGTVHSIFFDNCSNYDCYCADCRAGFRKFTRDKFGVEMDLAAPDKAPNFAFAKQLYDADTAVAFFKAIKVYLDEKYGPGILISPNIGVAYGWSDYLVNKGATDLVFIEEGFTMPPTDSTVLKYKTGLASSHGKTTGQLLGLAESLRRVRALALDKGNELGILESFVYPEEHMLALAEAAATGGTDCLSFALREQKISVSDAPYQVQMKQAITRYTNFQRQHLDLWDRAQPGAKVAVVHGIMTQLLERSPTVYRNTCNTLGAAGIPYEVLIEEDLTAEQLAQYQLVIMPRVTLLDPQRAAALATWVKAGGSLAVVSDLATRDELCRAYAPEQLPEVAKLPAGMAALGKGRTWKPAEGFEVMAKAALVKQLEDLTGGLECRLQTDSPRVFANILRSADGKSRSVHLVNSDVTYDLPPSPDLRDDDATPEARTYLAETQTWARKRLLVPDLAAVKGYSLKFFGATCGAATDAFSLVVSLNGQDLKTFRGSTLNESGWFEVPVPEGLLKPVNEIIFRATGQPSMHPDWFAIKLDTNATTTRSSWSTDGGKTWSEKDLSPDPGIQTGEYMVRFGPTSDPAAVAKPEDFMGKLKVTPARKVRVRVLSENAESGRLISPDGTEQTIQPRREGKVAVYEVPEVYVYSVLLLPEK
ncbi:MAG: alpha-amylase family protein [Armatimonadia bacterium]